MGQWLLQRRNIINFYVVAELFVPFLKFRHSRFGRKHPLKIFPGSCIAISSMKMWNIHIMIITHKLKELHEVYVVLMTPFND